MATVVVVGEVVVDRFVGGPEPVDVAGGSAANTALAMRTAGHAASLRARYSLDDTGRFLRSYAQDLGLDLTGSVDAREPATVVTVALRDGSPTYAFEMDGTADWQWTADEIGTALPAGCDAVVLGSLAAVMAPGCDVLRTWAGTVREDGVLVAYDPNARPTAVPRDMADVVRARITDWVSASDIVKVSDEDLAWIAPGHAAIDVAREWSTRGTRLVVMTAGPSGAWAFADGDEVAHCAAPAITVSDTVGAGDTLMGWLVSGAVDSGALGEANGPVDSGAIARVLQAAVTAAAITCTRQGCQPPTAGEVRQALAAS